MGADEPQFLDVDGRAIALDHRPASRAGAPGIFWLSGFRSDMTGTKAQALADLAAGRGWESTRFDYSGHGRSAGRFEDCTIGDWLAEAQAVLVRVTRGPQVVVGSSMGGYLALLLLRRLLVDDTEAASRIRALVLIAPAVDMTQDLMWDAFSPAQQAQLMTTGAYARPSEYGEPYLITRRLIEEGRDHLIGTSPFDPGRPVHILQGLLDDAVPPAHTRRLSALLTGGHATLEEIADGDHRLSRDADIARLVAVVAGLCDAGT